MKIASYLDQKHLKTYSTVSRQCRISALEHLVFTVRDCKILKDVVDAGARKIKLKLNGYIDTTVEPYILNKVVEVELNMFEVLDLQMFKNLKSLNI